MFHTAVITIRVLASEFGKTFSTDYDIQSTVGSHCGPYAKQCQDAIKDELQTSRWLKGKQLESATLLHAYFVDEQGKVQTIH
jgi:hypothetical protein|tara:strand:+ start:220 stop:465 length:246 start_codon:yes stop_codon:yes gene_type:complete